MRKKYLSALLFGALLVTSAGTFTSCKDYDDEIAGLQEQVDAIEKGLSELTTDFGELAYVSSVEFVDGKLKVTSTSGTVEYNIPDNNTTYTLSGSEEDGTVTITLTPSEGSAQNFEFELPAATAEFDASKLTIGEDGFIYYDGTKTGVSIPNSELNIVEIKDAAGCVVGYSVSFGGKTTNLMIVDAKLKGLVFNPDLYYGGIEAMKAATYAYYAKTVDNSDKLADKDLRAEDPNTAADLTYMTPGLVATYHLNPSNVKEEALPVEGLSFIAKDVESRSNVELKTEIYDRKVENGELTVTARLTDGSIKDINNGFVTVLALQAKTTGEQGDTIITSDYAAVVKCQYDNLKLAKVSTPENHTNKYLYTNAADAIADANHLAIDIEWNDVDGIDLAEYIQTHYTDETKTNPTCEVWDENANAGKVEKAGFEYRYDLIGWFDGVNQTSQSSHAAQNPNDESIIRAQMPVGGKQAAWGGEQSRAAIDRQPLVRVILFDTNSQKNAAVGYIKLNIVDTAVENQVTVIDAFDFDKVYTVSCSTTPFNFNLSWHQVEEQIIAHPDLGITKDEFEANYELDGFVASSTPATQFNNTTSGATALVSPVGEVTKTTADVDGNMTEVLQWTIAENDAYEAYYGGAQSMSAIVRFKKDLGDGKYHYVYVTFNWAPSQINAKPSGNLNDEAKIDEMWFKEYNSLQGNDEVHLNVAVPTAPTNTEANCTFEKNIYEVFDSSLDLITGISSVYTDFQNIDWYNSNHTTFRFVDPNGATAIGVSGDEYTLTISNNGTKLNANLVTIATIDANGNIEYLNNATAQDVLNYADHSELEKGETLSAKVEVIADNCSNTRPVELTNNVFGVRFLRPVTVDDKNNDGLIDGLDAGDEIALNEVISFSDWRNFNFNDVTGGYNYYTYYGVDGISVDVNEITTNLNGGTLGESLLKDKNANIDITFTAPTLVNNYIVSTDFGKLNYKNNGNVLSAEYQIRVPVEITYKWGTIKKDVDITIHPTTGQQN